MPNFHSQSQTENGRNNLLQVVLHDRPKLYNVTVLGNPVYIHLLSCKVEEEVAFFRSLTRAIVFVLTKLIGMVDKRTAVKIKMATIIDPIQAGIPKRDKAARQVSTQ